MKLKELRKLVRSVIQETLADGVFQSRARKSYSKMINLVGSGGTSKIRFDGDSSNLQNNFIGITGYDDLIIASDEANSATASTIQFRVDATERMRIDSSGNLLVGTTNTSVANQTGTTQGVRIAGADNIQVASTGVAAYFNKLSTDGSIVEFRRSAVPVGSISSSGGLMGVGTSNAGILFNSGANCLNPFKPSTNSSVDAAIDIGKSNFRFKDLYLSGGIYLGGTTSVNLLDDYEEGDFAPTYSIASGSITTTSNAGRYVKIGQLVFFTFRLRSSAASGTGVLTMTLPFATAAENRAGGSQGFARNWGSDMPNFRFYLQPSASTMIFYKNAMNTGSTQVTGSDVDTGGDNNVLEGSVVYKSAS